MTWLKLHHRELINFFFYLSLVSRGLSLSPFYLSSFFPFLSNFFIYLCIASCFPIVLSPLFFKPFLCQDSCRLHIVLTWSALDTNMFQITHHHAIFCIRAFRKYFHNYSIDPSRNLMLERTCNWIANSFADKRKSIKMCFVFADNNATWATWEEL